MKLYENTMAPNPRRVRIFLAEKGIEVPIQQIDIGAGETLSAEFLARNSLGKVPVLELDDGSHISESLAICRYFEEIQPEPPLMGVDAADRARVEMWSRRMEHEVIQRVFQCFQNTHEYFKDRIEQVPAFGEVCKKGVLERLAWLDGELGDRPFIAGDRYSVADITALVAIDFGRVVRIAVAPEWKNLARWHEAVSSRPSASA